MQLRHVESVLFPCHALTFCRLFFDINRTQFSVCSHNLLILDALRLDTLVFRILVVWDDEPLRYGSGNMPNPNVWFPD